MSTATVDSQKLYAWCQAILKELKVEREERCAKLVVAEWERYNTWRWWRPWRRRKITMEEAMSRIEDDYPFSEWQKAATKGWRLENVCKKMMAATVCADRVTVSTDDMETLHYWSPELATSIFRQQTLR